MEARQKPIKCVFFHILIYTEWKSLPEWPGYDTWLVQMTQGEGFLAASDFPLLNWKIENNTTTSLETK